MSKNIILIDKRVQDYETMVAAVDPALAVSVVFDYFEDTFDALKARIGALGLTNGTNQVSVGLIQHNYKAPMFSMLASAELAPVVSVSTHDPELDRWVQIRDFITWCKTEHSAAHFDMMACALYSDPDWKYVIDTLTAQTGVTIRASTDDTGAASLGGDWFLESHTGVNLKTVYFTEAIEDYRGILYLYPSDIREYPTKGFATGSVQAWGVSSDGGTASSSVTAANSGVVAVYSNAFAFVALKTDGSIVAWGNSDYGGTAPSSVTAANSGVVAVYSAFYAFAALKNDGSVVAWGDSSNGGTTPGNVSSGVVAVYSSFYAFAALKTDGSIVAWGSASFGGTGAPSSVTAANSGVVAVYYAQYAFAALKTDGSIVAWGFSSYGGTAPSSVTNANSGVVAVYSNFNAFAALKNNGSVVAWGLTGYGGSAPSSVTDANSGVVAVCSNNNNFAALKSDGSVVAWGSGGTAPSSVTAANSGVVAVYSNTGAFAALKSDGSVVAWGYDGGTAPSSVTAANSGVVAVHSTEGAFAALKSDGSVVAWGNVNVGGTTPGNVSSGVVAVYSTGGAFAALKNDGSVVAWGRSGYGGNGAPSSVTDANSGVLAVYSSFGAFAALKTTATTFDLSFSYYTNADRYDILRKKENRRRVNLTTLNNNVFTLSVARDIQVINPNIPAGKTLKIIVPDYTASSYSITSTATIPNSSGSFIVACDESEPVTISGTTYLNYGAYVYKREANNSYTKTTSATINGTSYTLYGGDGINSSGIVLLEVILEVSTFSAATFTVSSSKTFGDASFAITTQPTSNSTGAITYSSSNTSVATIDASGNFITLVGAGDVSFNATQAATAQYAAATKASNTLTVARGTPILSTFTVASSKTLIDASFVITAPRPTSNSTGAITYSSSNPDVATIDASGDWITLVAAGDVSFNATQAQTSQYLSATKASNTLTVSKATPTLAFVSPPTTKTLTDAAFTVVASSASSGAVTYRSSNTAFATVGASTGLVTLKAAGTVTITAAQAESAQYNAPTNTTCSIVISAAGSELAGQTVSPGTSFASLNLSGASLVGSTLSGVSFSGATLTNVDFSGATITGTNFTNANISGATNLPAFSPVQKLQLLKNINNVAIEAVQITTASGSAVAQLLSNPIAGIDNLTFSVVTPTTVDVNSNKTITITSAMIGSSNVYLPINTEEPIVINGTVYRSNGTNIIDANDAIVNFVTIDGVPFRVYAGSFVGINTLTSLNSFKIDGDGMYDVLSSIFKFKT